PGSIFAFADNHVIIPMTVLEELDKFKTGNNELGRNSREVVRRLDALRCGGSLREGVATEQGGLVQVVLRYDELTDLLPGVADNRIIGCANILKREGHDVVFVSKDINARIKADALGIPSADYENQKVDIRTLYAGWRKFELPGALIHHLREHGTVQLPPDLVGETPLVANEFVLLRSTDDEARAIGRYRPDHDHVILVPDEVPRPYGISPRNLEQRMAMDLLLDDNVRLVTMVGSAGTGKTLIALAAGMAKVLRDGSYNKLLVSRPIMPMGKDIGYLPGSKDEKMSHWMGPIFDNLEFILDKEERDPDAVIKRLLKDETITLEALTYIRGRSISRQYMIVDEAQNLTPHEIKTIISRAGEMTKIIITGDPYQIDNPYLDADSNGLTYLAERIRDHELSGHVTLTRSERSQLAGLAADVL
ncbi:MAG: PhoH family protein, partial [Planctomycetota bacterium]